MIDEIDKDGDGTIDFDGVCSVSSAPVLRQKYTRTEIVFYWAVSVQRRLSPRKVPFTKSSNTA